MPVIRWGVRRYPTRRSSRNRSAPQHIAGVLSGLIIWRLAFHPIFFFFWRQPISATGECMSKVQYRPLLEAGVENANPLNTG